MRFGLIFSLILIGCSSKHFESNFNFNTECLGVEFDGSQTIRVWGSGRNRIDAIEQAKKKGVSEIIFQGIREGVNGCEIKPLLSEANARDRYQMYFNDFFSDNGDYKKFVNLRDERIGKRFNRDRIRSKNQVSYALILRIRRPQLKKQLIKDGIIK